LLRCKAKNIYFNHVLTKQLCPRISTFRSWSENSKKKVKEVSSPFLPKSPLGDSNLKHVFSYVHKSWKKRKKAKLNLVQIWTYQNPLLYFFQRKNSILEEKKIFALLQNVYFQSFYVFWK
jgi:hypothetical protein